MEWQIMVGLGSIWIDKNNVFKTTLFKTAGFMKLTFWCCCIEASLLFLYMSLSSIWLQTWTPWEEGVIILINKLISMINSIDVLYTLTDLWNLILLVLSLSNYWWLAIGFAFLVKNGYVWWYLVQSKTSDTKEMHFEE